MYQLIFLRKYELNAVNLTGTHSFLHLAKWSFCFSTPHLRGSEIVMIIPSSVLFMEYLTLQVV